jgi:hypothetical protein
MDWYLILFVLRWAIIALFYAVLLLLLAAVYREGSARIGRGGMADTVTYGRLRVIHPGGDPRLAAGTTLGLKAHTRLGAAPDNDVVLSDPFVSGYHLRLRWDGAGWWLEDLNSKNGTLVNRQAWPAGQARPLPTPAVLTLGDMVLELVE